MYETETGTPGRLDHVFFDDEVRPYLGAVILKSRLLRADQLDEALAEQQRSRKRLGEILIERGWLFPPDVARALASQHGLDYVDIQYTSVDPRAAATLNPDIGRRHCAIPVRFLTDGRILVAVSDPTSSGTRGDSSRARRAGRVRRRRGGGHPKRLERVAPRIPAVTPPRGLLLDLDSVSDVEAFVLYLARLGCEVETPNREQIRVSVSYPETVDDEIGALREWYASWLRLHPQPEPPRVRVSS